MSTFYCIYGGAEYPAEQRSLEHIVPYALGGPGDFGTNDVAKVNNNNVGTGHSTARVLCARRLAASLMKAPLLVPASPTTGRMCSTPCGVTDEGTPQIVPSHLNEHVLNALRRH